MHINTCATHNVPRPIENVMNSIGWFTKCMLACEAAAVEAGFVPEAGRDLYLGLIVRYNQHWSDEEFSSWVVSMLECYGKKSSLSLQRIRIFHPRSPKSKQLNKIQ